VITYVPPAIRSMASGVMGRLRGFGGSRVGVATSVATSISISPASASFAKGKTQQYTATVLDQFGANMGLTVTWSSNSANVSINSSTGLASGDAYGAATLTATYQSLTNTAAATVQQPTQLAMITQPGGATTGSAFTTQPVIELRDAGNSQDSESGRTVTASIVAGTGTLSGTTSVVTDSNGRAVFTNLVITGTGNHTLTFASTGLTGVSSGSFVVAASSTLLFTETFADSNFAGRGWYSIVSADRVATPTPAGQSGSLRINWPVGETLPPNCRGMRKLFTATDSLYLRYQQAATANWIGNGLASEPHVILVLSDQDDAFQGPSDCFLALYSEVNYQSGNVGWVRFQDNQYIDSANIGFNVSEARGTSGANGQQGYADSWDLFQIVGAFSHDWYATRNLTTGGPLTTPGDTAFHTVEVEVILNSISGGIGQTDGICRFWWDGVLRFERTNLIMRTGTRPTIKFNQFMFSPNLGVASSVNQSLYIADLEVRTARP